MNTACAEWQNEMLDGLFARLTDERQRGLEEHLARCAACRAYRGSLEEEERALAELNGELEAVVRRGRERVMATVAERVGVERVERPAQRPTATGVGMTGAERPAIQLLPDNRPAGTGLWKLVRYGAMAAAVAIVVFGGFSLRQGRPGAGDEAGQWWLTSPAWGQEVAARMAAIRAVVHVERVIFVEKSGSTHVSGSWSRRHVAAVRKRVDHYYEQTPVGTTWELPEGDDLVRTDVSYEFQCYTTERVPAGAGRRNPMAELRAAVEKMGRAERLLGTRTIEGRECVGFDVREGQYSMTGGTSIDRIWFDAAARLPVRIEMHGRPITDHPELTVTLVHEQFEYDVELEAGLFEPAIPQGYANAPAGEVHEARERAANPDLVYAEVPAGLKDEIVAAASRVRLASYRDGAGMVYVSPDAWRRDTLSGERVTRREWWVIQKQDPSEVSLDVTDPAFRLTCTRVDYDNHRYEVKEYGPKDHPRHPLDDLRHPMGYIDQADRFEADRPVDGRECLYVEVSARKYGTNPVGMMHCMWFDRQTWLPVRMELRWANGGVTKAEGFEWEPALPADTFVPVVPEGFVEEQPAIPQR